jgi:hypothetical protein
MEDRTTVGAAMLSEQVSLFQDKVDRLPEHEKMLVIRLFLQHAPAMFAMSLYFYLGVLRKTNLHPHLLEAAEDGLIRFTKELNGIWAKHEAEAADPTRKLSPQTLANLDTAIQDIIKNARS